MPAPTLISTQSIDQISRFSESHDLPLVANEPRRCQLNFIFQRVTLSHKAKQSSSSGAKSQ